MSSTTKSVAATSTGADTGVRATRYRWVVLTAVFVTYVVCMADRSNIGAVLPLIKHQFTISNFESGAIASFFFLGYALSQIPAGLLMGRIGTRTVVTVAVLAFSVVTFLMGFTTAAIGLLVLRLLLGLAEGPAPVGMTSTINAWFPAREKGTATGVYIASTQFAPIIVPPIAIEAAMPPSICCCPRTSPAIWPVCPSTIDCSAAWPACSPAICVDCAVLTACIAVT